MCKTLLVLASVLMLAIPNSHAQRGQGGNGGGGRSFGGGGSARSSGGAGGGRSFYGGNQAALSGNSGRSFSRGRYGGGYRSNFYGSNRYRGGRVGRYYYLGGTPYYYPFFGYGLGYGGFGYGGFGYGLGYGYPSYAYNGYWSGYAAGPYGYGGYSDDPGVYNGRLANDDGDSASGRQPQGASLPVAVQRQLTKRGYYKGKADGQFGATTRSALSRFQRDKGIKQSGRIDEDTLEALGFTDGR